MTETHRLRETRQPVPIVMLLLTAKILISSMQ